MRKYGNYTSEGHDTKANFAWQTSSLGEFPYGLVSKTKEFSEHYCKFTFPFMTTLVLHPALNQRRGALTRRYKYLKVFSLYAKNYHPFTGSKIVSYESLSKSEERQQLA